MRWVNVPALVRRVAELAAQALVFVSEAILVFGRTSQLDGALPDLVELLLRPLLVGPYLGVLVLFLLRFNTVLLARIAYLGASTGWPWGAPDLLGTARSRPDAARARARNATGV